MNFLPQESFPLKIQQICFGSHRRRIFWYLRPLDHTPIYQKCDHAWSLDNAIPGFLLANGHGMTWYMSYYKMTEK